ncbi:MAG: ribosome recycling factor [Bacilli bacterium]|jgi:ribosome recycling factor|nr:ribosome recycling factor [Bacilli bacterium]MDY0063961.1 ribosome recycling factor [Bacilli bacterium]
MPQTIINHGEERMNKSIEAFKKEIALLRTGRANPTVLNNVNVVYYGTPTPLNQIASISVPEAQVLMIKPFDKYILKDIEKAIQLADLNLVPVSDGVVIRINFPALTESRRKDLVKELKTLAENNKVSIRNIRRDMMEHLKKMEKDGELSEDDLKRRNEEVQKLTDKFIEKIDALTKEKETSIMEI